MNALRIMRELELAAFELAEAESHERAAKALRVKATKRTSAVHAEIAAAVKAAVGLPPGATPTARKKAS